VPDVDDLATARALIATLHDEVTKLQREKASLQHQLDVLCQRMFGKKSERVDPRQLQLALEQLANEPGPVTEPIEMDSGETPVRGERPAPDRSTAAPRASAAAAGRGRRRRCGQGLRVWPHEDPHG
jgi:uncharacterized coiled-coil protein SlyX